MGAHGNPQPLAPHTLQQNHTALTGASGTPIPAQQIWGKRDRARMGVGPRSLDTLTLGVPAGPGEA